MKGERREQFRADVLGLRALGLSYAAIAGAILHYRGVRLTEHQVRLWCAAWGVPKDARKVRR